MGLEAILLKSPLAPAMMKFISANQYGWLMILGAFILAGWLGRSMASNARTITTQYLGLGFYVAASLELFASVALLFWYVLRIVMSLSRR